MEVSFICSQIEFSRVDVVGDDRIRFYPRHLALVIPILALDLPFNFFNRRAYPPNLLLTVEVVQD